MTQKKALILYFLVIPAAIISVLALQFKYSVTPKKEWHSCFSDSDCTDETVCYDIPLNKKFQKQARVNQSLLPYTSIQCWDRLPKTIRKVQCVKSTCKVIKSDEKVISLEEMIKCEKTEDCIAIKDLHGRYHPTNMKYEKEFRNYLNFTPQEQSLSKKFEVVVTNVDVFCKKQRCEVKEQIKKIKRRNRHEENPFGRLFGNPK